MAVAISRSDGRLSNLRMGHHFVGQLASADPYLDVGYLSIEPTHQVDQVERFVIHRCSLFIQDSWAKVQNDALGLQIFELAIGTGHQQCPDQP